MLLKNPYLSSGEEDETLMVMSVVEKMKPNHQKQREKAKESIATEASEK